MTVALLAAADTALALLLVLICAECGHRGELARAAKADAAAAREELEARGYQELVGRQVVMHLEDRSLRGVYVRAWEDGHTLAHPEWLQGAQPAELGGEMFVPAHRVTMVQVFEPDA